MKWHLFQMTFFFFFPKKILKIKCLEAGDGQWGRNPRWFLFSPTFAQCCPVPTCLRPYPNKGEGVKDAAGIPGKDWEMALSPALEPCFQHRCWMRLLWQHLLCLGLGYFGSCWLLEKRSTLEL